MGKKNKKQKYQSESPSKPRTEWIGIGLAVVFVVSAIVWFSSQKSAPPPPPPPVVAPAPVIVVPAPDVFDPDNSGHHLRWDRNKDGTKKYFWRDDDGKKHWWPKETPDDK